MMYLNVVAPVQSASDLLWSCTIIRSCDLNLTLIQMVVFLTAENDLYVAHFVPIRGRKLILLIWVPTRVHFMLYESQPC